MTSTPVVPPQAAHSKRFKGRWPTSCLTLRASEGRGQKSAPQLSTVFSTTQREPDHSNFCSPQEPKREFFTASQCTLGRLSMVVPGAEEKTQPSERDALFESVSENSLFKLQSRRACPELVERGRLNLAQDASPGLDLKGRPSPAGTAENRPRRNPGQPSVVQARLNS
jgi:hypothetical protein